MGAILIYHNKKLNLELRIERDTLAEARMDFDDYVDDTGSRPEEWELKKTEKYPRRVVAVKLEDEEALLKK